jgi:hypothetical protein
VSGVSSEKARASLKPDTRHLKPMLREGFTTPDNVQKKDLFFYHVVRSGVSDSESFYTFQKNPYDRNVHQRFTAFETGSKFIGIKKGE